ncbi:MAG: DUF2378 family protein [Archangium sp.]|nr:DUF2378 family protein [Archangium sp.]
MDTLLAAAKPALTPSLIAKLQAIGLDPTKKTLPAYPAQTSRDAVLLCAKALNPQLSEDDALFALGRRFVERYGESIMGSALAAAARMLGPKRMLNRVAVQFGNANNYENSGAKDVKVTVERNDASGAVFRILWRE